MIFADTGFFIAMINKRDALHENASVWSEFLVRNEQRLLTTEQVLWETLNYCRSMTFRDDSVALVDALRTDERTRIVWADNETFAEAFNLYRARSDKTWSLTDCSSFLVMQQYGVTNALAHDIDFEQAGFRPLLRESPPG